jgi:hypothetical protein
VPKLGASNMHDMLMLYLRRPNNKTRLIHTRKNGAAARRTPAAIIFVHNMVLKYLVSSTIEH